MTVTEIPATRWKRLRQADIPIHCVVQLDPLVPVTVRMNFIAAKVVEVEAGN